MTQKKKIVLFGIKYYPSQGGTSRVAESIIRHLQDKYQFIIYCYKTKNAGYPKDDVRVIRIPRFPFGPVGVFFYYLICCIHLLFSRPCDLIHLHKTDAAIFIPVLRLKSRVIATSHEAPYLRDKWNAFGKAYFRFMEKIFIRSSAVLTSVSKPLADYYYRRYQREVQYVPNGVDISKERNATAAEAILRKYQVEDNFLFFAARRIMATKGCHTFLEAAKEMNFRGSIVIAGEGSHATVYMARIKQLAEGLTVKFIGYIGDKPTLMSLIERAGYFIFPSETEGLSIMLLEVGSMGKTPLICSDIPENTQVFSDEEVLFFKNKDAADLMQKLRWAEAHPEEMKEKMKKAYKRVVTEYPSSVSANKYDELYQKTFK